MQEPTRTSVFLEVRKRYIHYKTGERNYKPIDITCITVRLTLEQWDGICQLSDAVFSGYSYFPERSIMGGMRVDIVLATGQTGFFVNDEQGQRRIGEIFTWPDQKEILQG